MVAGGNFGAGERRMGGLRQRVRAELIVEIKAAGRQQLEAEGASGLSLRAVARELQMASSAIYRYVSSRDELITLLIVDAYGSLADAVEAAERSRTRRDLAGRFTAVARSARAWALAHPTEYALVFGSPIPGYSAPADRTVEPATRIPALLMKILVDGTASGAFGAGSAARPMTARARRQLEQLADSVGAPVPPRLLATGLAMWVEMFGWISFEVFGQLPPAVTDREAVFENLVQSSIARLGLGSPR
jgi:AcrR family transcriptional regulator